MSNSPPSQKSEEAYAYRLSLDDRALAKLAQSTAAPIATLLTIPDAVALLPNAQSPIGWLLAVIGVWLIAAILWFVGFWGILHVLKIFSGDIKITNDGLKLWRFGRIIAWPKITALSLEEQNFFAKICQFEPAPTRLRLFLLKDQKSDKFKIQDIPSFLFSQEDFQKLFTVVAYKALSTKMQTADVLLARDRLDAVKATYVQKKQLGVVLSCLIALSLISFLGKKAAVNYIYASANKSFNARNYQVAVRRYKKALALEPSFAVAWNNLAGAEFRLNDIDDARKDWQLALKLKPDLVEAKISLAYLLIKQRQFSQAEDLLHHALALAPDSKEALVDMAELNMRQGRTKEAMKFARQALTIDPTSNLALCLIAEGELHLGRPQKALTLLQRQKPTGLACALVEGQIYAALNDLPLAANAFAFVVKQSPNNVDAIVSLSLIKARENDFAQAEILADRAIKLAGNNNPWPYLAKTNIELLKGNSTQAKNDLTTAVNVQSQEANSLAYAADIAARLGLTDEAVRQAKRALVLDRQNSTALATLKRLNHSL